MTIRCTKDLSAWRALAPFHYKSHAVGIVDRLFVMELAGEPIGVAVLGYPAGQVALRNRVTQGRYAGKRLTRSARRALLNREVRTITRVVLRPEFRGCGLAWRLVRHVLEQAGVPFVEALAAMGQVNRFFERAGMKRIGPVRRSGAHQGLAQAFLQAGAAPADLSNPDRLAAVYEQAAGPRREALDRALERFDRAMGGRRPAGPCSPPQRRRTLVRAAATLTAEPVYYFWQRAEETARAEARGQERDGH